MEEFSLTALIISREFSILFIPNVRLFQTKPAFEVPGLDVECSYSRDWAPVYRKR